MRLTKKKMRGLEFVQEEGKHIAEFLLTDFMENSGSFGVPGRVEVRDVEIEGIKADPTITMLQYAGQRMPIKIGPYYMRSIKKIPFWRRLVVWWKCTWGVD